MPDPTNTNNNQNQQQDQTTPTVTPVIPPSDLPPFPTATTTPTVNNNDTGSSAPPPNFPDLNVDAPKKKFGGGKGKIIATILGILMLVGGVGAGAYLTLQNQNINEQAAGAECRKGPSCGNGYEGASGCTGCKSDQVCCKSKSGGGTTVTGCAAQTTQKACNSSCANNNQCKWIDGTCKKSENVCGEGGGNIDPGGEETTPGNCSTAKKDAGWVQCGSGTGGSECTFCLNPSTKTCNQLLAERKCATGVGGAGGCAAVTGAVNIYYCEGKGVDSSGGCSQNDKIPSGAGWDSTNKNIKGSFCGTIQVDMIGTGTNGVPLAFCSRYDESGCSTPKPPTPTSTPKPTPSPSPKPTPTPPPPTAQCVNVKAYSSTWTALSTTQLAQLKSGNTVNFCVVGSASSGIFDKAKFTINGNAQAETTTKRPNTQDYCQSYVIPAGTYSFNVTAQIHHSTLGWK